MTKKSMNGIAFTVNFFHIELHYEPITSESWGRVVGP